MAVEIHLESLADIPQLGALRGICKKLNIEITAHGSVVRRLYRRLLQGEKEWPDLFQLAPYLSDIDLRHNGTNEQTTTIREAILSEVPYAEFFRWEISSEANSLPFREDEAHLPVIPLNKLTLATRAEIGIQDPFNAIEDLKTGRFRLLDNPFYSRSNLRRSHRDIGFLHAIAFLHVLCDEKSNVSALEHPGWDPCCKLIRQSETDETIISLGESSYLRARVGYRLAALQSVCRSEKQWREIMNESGLKRLIERILFMIPGWNLSPMAIGYSLAWHTNPSWIWSNPHACGCRIGGDLFRIMTNRQEARQEPQSAESAWSSLEKTHKPLKSFFEQPFPPLAETQQVLAASPRFQFRVGKAPSSLGDEHVHIQFPLDETAATNLARYREQELGVVVVLSTDIRELEASEGAPVRSHGLSLALPGACALHQFQLLQDPAIPFVQIRVNFGRVLEVFPELIKKAELGSIASLDFQTFIVADLHTHE